MATSRVPTEIDCVPLQLPTYALSASSGEKNTISENIWENIDIFLFSGIFPTDCAEMSDHAKTDNKAVESENIFLSIFIIRHR